MKKKRERKKKISYGEKAAPNDETGRDCGGGVAGRCGGAVVRSVRRWERLGETAAVRSQLLSSHVAAAAPQLALAAANFGFFFF